MLKGELVEKLKSYKYRYVLYWRRDATLEAIREVALAQVTNEGASPLWVRSAGSYSAAHSVLFFSNAIYPNFVQNHCLTKVWVFMGDMIEAIEVQHTARKTEQVKERKASIIPYSIRNKRNGKGKNAEASVYIFYLFLILCNENNIFSTTYMLLN